MAQRPQDPIEEELDEIQDIFGVNREVAEEIRLNFDQPPKGWFAHQLSIWGFFIIMVGGFGVGWRWIWPYFERLQDTHAAEQATQIGAILVGNDFGFGMLAWLFGWIFSAGAVLALVYLVLPLNKRFSRVHDAMMSSDSQPFGAGALNAVAEHASSVTSSDEFARRWLLEYIRRVLRIASLPIAVGVVLIWAELTSGDYITEEEVVIDRFIPFTENKILPWSTAELVELGCNQTDDGASLVYKVVFPTRSVRISSADPVKGTDYLASLEAIDERLRASNAEFVRWEWLKRDPLNPKCLRSFYGEYEPGGKARIDRLLRVGQL
ncbi:hypothetical protein HK107_02755 [Parvularcula sp. ZS-1/3]|uniref:Uncharacterized protein n=1 Tax=Parvularcula mediterranea TaxID=2732508 RepID=A0A7Y3RJJ4_9PROT|nr:hypothetical protein [Parvularcula mediterranea]NNU15244.1 hypothetical protein [Parvularcula mediterranea]